MQNTIDIIMRNDDPGPLSDPAKERRVLEIFEKYHIPQVLAVIPNNVEDPHVCSRADFHPLEENPAVIEILKEYQKKGLVEIAQHGYTHQTTKLRPSINEEITETEFYQGIDRKWVAYKPAHPDGYSEFNGLSVAQQREKVETGQKYLEKIFGLKFDTFIFPWNSYNKDVFKILRSRGYKFVPGDQDQFIFPDVCMIGCCNWDWETKRFRRLVRQVENLNKPVLMQFAYHSWELSDEYLLELDELLADLSSMKNIVFITPGQIPQLAPWAPGIIRLRSLMAYLEGKLSLCLDKKIMSPKYYVKDHGYYLRRIMSLSLAVLFLKYLGLNKWKMFSSIVGNHFSQNIEVSLSSMGGYAPKTPVKT